MCLPYTRVHMHALIHIIHMHIRVHTQTHRYTLPQASSSAVEVGGGTWSQAELASREASRPGEGVQGYFLEEAA